MSTIAQTTLWLELIAIIISLLYYFRLCYSKENQKLLKRARLSYLSFTGLTTLASIFLMVLFFNHDFEYKYVIQYSSSDLPIFYLISSFWAGQEGSFLLWVLMGAWLGVILLFKSRHTEPHVMVLYNLPYIFLTILLIKQSPFATVANPPSDGSGLNMLLQDPWMVIHPPIVFLGYAAFTIPFALAMASLWRREYDKWVTEGLSWVAFSFVSLGAGIIIGGVWAYKVLGWGGYWGWDPVENASLLPWLTGTALLHGMILQKSTNRLAKTNYFLAALSFILIIYSTFLTRSGVLANFSVHTFEDLGITGWLVFFIFAFIFLSAYLMMSRSKEIPLPKKKSKSIKTPFFSREFGLTAAVILLCLSALLTGLGTSFPLITRFMEKTSTVTTQFYTKTNLPIAILIGLFLSYIPLLSWGKNNPTKFLPKIVVGSIIAIISAMITLINGFPGILIFLMILFAGFTIGVNLELTVKLLTKKFTTTSGAMAHLGVGLMLIAFIASTVYNKSQLVNLPQGETKDVMDYKFKFIESRLFELKRGIRVYLPLEIYNNNKIIFAQPDIYVQYQQQGENKRFHHPFILRSIWSDLYISPAAFEQQNKGNSHLVIRKGETITFQDYNISFIGYDVSGMAVNQDQHSMSVGAELKVTYQDGDPVFLNPIYTVNQTDNPNSRVKLPGPQEAYLALVGMNASQKNIQLHYDGPTTQKPAMLTAEVSIKPGMSLLWLGVILLLLGGTISIYRRLPKAEK